MAKNKPVKPIDQEASLHPLNPSTPRGRRRLSLLVILTGLVISLLYSNGVFSDLTNSVPHPSNGVYDTPFRTP